MSGDAAAQQYVTRKEMERELQLISVETDRLVMKSLSDLKDEFREMVREEVNNAITLRAAELSTGSSESDADEGNWLGKPVPAGVVVLVIVAMLLTIGIIGPDTIRELFLGGGRP